MVKFLSGILASLLICNTIFPVLSKVKTNAHCQKIAPGHTLTEDENLLLDNFETEEQNVVNFSMASYFENLYENSPINTGGSCGFVSLIQVMAYYDTFLNDEVIPYDYDVRSLNINTSPGVLRQSKDSNITIDDFILNNKNNDLQCMLFDIYKQVKELDSYDTSIGLWDYDDVLGLFYGETSTWTMHEYAMGSSVSVQENYYNYIKSKIDDGFPVVVHIMTEPDSMGNSSRHSVVAYDYDEDNIYAHYGWGENSTRRPLIEGVGGYTRVYYAGYLEYHYGHSHSDNYLIDGTYFCGCGASDTHSHLFSEWVPENKRYHERNCLTCSFSELKAHVCQTMVGQIEQICVICGAVIPL